MRRGPSNNLFERSFTLQNIMAKFLKKIWNYNKTIYYFSIYWRVFERSSHTFATKDVDWNHYHLKFKKKQRNDDRSFVLSEKKQRRFSFLAKYNTITTLLNAFLMNTSTIVQMRESC